MTTPVLQSPAVAAVARDGCVPRSVWRRPDGAIVRDLHPRELAHVHASGEGVLWVDLDSTETAQHALLEKMFRFHPLAIEDTLNPKTRVKYEEYDGYLFVVMRGVRFCDETPDPYDIETVNLCFFLGPNWLVTVHAQAQVQLDDLLTRAERSPEMLARGPARVMHAILDAAVDSFFPTLERIDDFVDGLEERVFSSGDQETLRDIFAVKRVVVTMRRHLAPAREVLNQLTNRPTELISASTQLYFRDVYDHVLRINDSLDAYRELLASTLDSYLSQVSNRFAQASKALGVVATVTLPYVIVSGMWGMNFDRVPLAHHPYGFWILVGVQLCISAVILLTLRRRGIL